ncbi:MULTISPECIES: DUF5134 domain-containing protein [unclassified Streptomyces]|uniref:DUF5134 domain-containing protein n=1 Tax=unclassified Streptomyces TaxID=2593676 RepID=UPI002E2DFD48|nr:DUF5134 domain-containing protein [Streptomyces sp. NBC_00228]WSW96386.1 DUF5134 domain-containing protein [Streptomyces sp. NBC_00989]
MDLGPIAWVAAGMALVMGASELPRLAGHHTFSRPGVAADVLMSACMAAMVCPATEGMFIAVGWWPVLFVLAGVACAAAGARQAVRPDHRHGGAHWFQHAVACGAMVCMVLAMRSANPVHAHPGMTMAGTVSGWAIACAALALYFILSMAVILWRQVVSDGSSRAEAVPVVRIAMAGITAVMLLTMV